ncbi:MAG: HD domain-containing protein [Treponema sp.]|nr:HD domain-containing protein [Candidatus Treponema caballi]
MKSKLIDRIKEYFYIPAEKKLDISKSNLKLCEFAIIFLFILGISGFIIELTRYYPYRIDHFTYYGLYLVISVLYLLVSHFTKKKNSYKVNQTVILFSCTFIILLILYFISNDINISHVLMFYFAIVIMIITFNITPIFYTIALVSFLFEVDIFSSNIGESRIALIVNNSLFCIALMFFSFYKRRLLSVREKNKLEIEKQNRLLREQNEELNRQKSSLLISKQYLENTVFNQSQELQAQKEHLINIQNSTIISLSNLAENRDEDAGDHILRTRDYVRLIAIKARQTGLYPELSEPVINLYVKAAPMHDIGKIAISDEVLKKPGKLSAEEYEQIKLHTVKGGKIVKDVLGSGEDEDYVTIAKDIAMYHHENYDGTGYPEGLKGDDIPLPARIMAIAAVFDALVSPRVYKEPIPLEEAFNDIEKAAGTRFDPELVALFLDSKDEVIEILNKYQK